MMSHHAPHGRHVGGLRRREVLQIGSSALLGLGLSSVMARANPVAKPKSVLIVFLTGAASHHDTFDPKPDAPAEVRGEFRAIPTSVPGTFVSEHLPHLAARAHRYALLRTFSHGDNNHLMSTHHVLTGHVQPGGFFDKVASRDDWPCYSAGLAYLRPQADGMPNGVNLPTFLMSSPLTWPGQHAGFLGAKYDPWQITEDPNKPDFRVDTLSLLDGLNLQRLGHRQELLADLNRQQRRIEEVTESRRLSNEQQLAFDMLTSNRLGSAFQMDRESDAVRDRYGRNAYGQSLLLSRRLIQAGVPIVQCNIGRVQNWDNHSEIFPTLKNRLLPPLDQGMAALLDDLESMSLLDDTFVMMLGEFGRTPKVNGTRGRDHWGPCFTGLFAGGGVRPGQVIGKSDEIGAYPLTAAYSPDDLGATVYRVLGLDPQSEVRDRLNRPIQLNRGDVIEPLFTGA